MHKHNNRLNAYNSSCDIILAICMIKLIYYTRYIGICRRVKNLGNLHIAYIITRIKYKIFSEAMKPSK